MNGRSCFSREHWTQALDCANFSDGSSEMMATHDAFLSDLTPEELIDYNCNRLHSFVCYENHLNYIFPSIKEFNQQYYSIESER